MWIALGVYGVLLPALAAAISYLIFARPLRAGGGGWVVPPTLALAYAVGYVGILGPPPLPPREAMHWTFWIALAAAVVGIGEALARWPPAIRWSVRSLFVVGALRGLLDPLVDHAWGGGANGWLRLAGVVCLALAAWFVLERAFVARPGPPWLTWACLTVLAAGTALTLALTGTLSLGQLAGSLAAGLVVTLAASHLLRGPTFEVASVFVPASVLSALVLTGCFYSSLPASSALLLGFAPIVLWFRPARLAGDTRYGIRTHLLRALPLLVPVAAAVLLALLASPSDEY